MNTETGRIYNGPVAISQAKARGENVVSISPRVAQLMKAAQRQIDRKVANLARTRPDLSDEERRDLAMKMN